MQKTAVWKKQWIGKGVAAALFVMLAVWVIGLLADVTRTEAEEIFLTPLLTDAKGWDMYVVENGSRREISSEEVLEMEPGRVFYLSRTLTKEQESGGYTFLLLDILRPCVVFLDGKLLYTNCPGDDMRMDAVSLPEEYADTPPAQGESVRCTLPAHFAGSRLTIATAQEYEPFMPKIILSSYTAESELLISSTGRELMQAAGFTVAALTLAGIWLFAAFQGIRDYPSLLLILAALVQMFSHLRQFSFLVPSSYAIDSPMAAFIPQIEVLLPLIWLLLQMKERKSRLIFGGILGLSAAVSLIVPAGQLFGGLPFFSRFLDQSMILFCPLAALLFFAVREAVKAGNRVFTLLLTGLGMTACLLAVLYIGSLWNRGFYANQIAAVFDGLCRGFTANFFYWCAVILFVLSVILALYQIIRRIAGMRVDLVLQTEHARQLDSQLSVQKEFYETRLSHEKEIRSLRHDMAGHLNTLAALFEEDKLSEAKNYLDGIAAYHKEQTSEIFSTNPYINAVLQNYAAKCQKEHVELVCHIGVDACELPVTELCLILNNALENALTASLTMPEGDRVIKVQAAVRQNLFLLRVSNRFDGEVEMENGLPVSGKEGKEHGYGLSNIRQAAVRRDGNMECRVESGYFVLDVTLPVLGERDTGGKTEEETCLSGKMFD